LFPTFYLFYYNHIDLSKIVYGTSMECTETENRARFTTYVDSYPQRNLWFFSSKTTCWTLW